MPVTQINAGGVNAGMQQSNVNGSGGGFILALLLQIGGGVL
jgi:hypothetical protein